MLGKIKTAAPRAFANFETILQSKNTAPELWFTMLVASLPANTVTIRELAGRRVMDGDRRVRILLLLDREAAPLAERPAGDEHLHHHPLGSPGLAPGLSI
eukprot:SAG25_NODE_1267_length_3448_cov_59.641387_1_plen_100_part_00